MKYLQEYKLYEFLSNNNQFKKIISESGTRPLFHALKSTYAKKALEENKLDGYSHQRSWEGGIRYKDDHPKYEESDYFRGISTTRDIEYASKFNEIIFVFDWNKIKQKYKVLPYNWGYLIGKGYQQKSIKREREEFIVTGHSYLKDIEKDEDEFEEDVNIKNRYLNIQINKMLQTPKGSIEPLNKYLIGFFISGRFYDLMSKENKTYFENHKKYLGVYTDNDWSKKNISFKDKIKKVFKKFENVNETPEEGDYVAIDIFNNEIGQIIEIPFKGILKVKFNTETKLKIFLFKNIIAFGKTPEEVELKLQSNKYNL